MMMGDTASQGGNLAQLSKVCKEKTTHKKKPHQIRDSFLNASGDHLRLINGIVNYARSIYKKISEL